MRVSAYASAHPSQRDIRNTQAHIHRAVSNHSFKFPCRRRLFSRSLCAAMDDYLVAHRWALQSWLNAKPFERAGRTEEEERRAAQMLEDMKTAEEERRVFWSGIREHQVARVKVSKKPNRFGAHSPAIDRKSAMQGARQASEQACRQAGRLAGRSCVCVSELVCHLYEGSGAKRPW